MISPISQVGILRLWQVLFPSPLIWRFAGVALESALGISACGREETGARWAKEGRRSANRQR